MFLDFFPSPDYLAFRSLRGDGIGASWLGTLRPRPRICRNWSKSASRLNEMTMVLTTFDEF